ncbi:uncharacterized protein GBIM_08483 [Gryllus bimaculatus]|nr:uncharacterized protein GBIM_08483 [Gryllus bimaculatus]
MEWDGQHYSCASVTEHSRAAAYDSVRPLAYPDARVFLLCFRIGDPDSLENAVRKVTFSGPSGAVSLLHNTFSQDAK